MPGETMDNVRVHSNKATKPIVWTVYVIIMFEMIYMSSPFAVFFYSVYGMPLKFLAENSHTAWLIRNILPHFTQTNSILINTLLYISWPLMGIGLLVFIVGFCQVYWAKFRRRGPVVGGLYRFIRHPQYAGWAIFGFGMTIFWSRMIVLIMYISMLFVYYLLAIREEKECLETYGDSYRSYLRLTGRFLPRITRKNNMRARPFLPRKGPSRVASLIAMYLIAMGGTISLGFVVRSHTLSEISARYEKNAAVVSLTPMNEKQMSSILSVTLNDQTVKYRLESLPRVSRGKRLFYIVPSEWSIPELSIESNVSRGHHHGFNPTNHGNPTSFDHNRYKMLLSRAVVDQSAEGKEILSKALGQKPFLLVHVNLKENRVTDIETPPQIGKYGDLPVPVI
jgi:protein-S-isoprenylcysteine O-methyltransferase Ste14